MAFGNEGDRGHGPSDPRPPCICVPAVYLKTPHHKEPGLYFPQFSLKAFRIIQVEYEMLNWKPYLFSHFWDNVIFFIEELTWSVLVCSIERFMYY